MKKILLVFLMIILLVTLCSCANNSTSTSTTESDHLPYKGIITWGSNGVYHIEVEDYWRISSGWIVITATDGKQYCTNEKNVLIIKDK